MPQRPEADPTLKRARTIVVRARVFEKANRCSDPGQLVLYEFLPGNQAGPRHADPVGVGGVDDYQIAMDELERILLDAHFDGFQQNVVLLREASSDDDGPGVEDVDEIGQLQAEFPTHLLHDVLAKRIFVVGRLDDVQNRRGVGIRPAGQSRGSSGVPAGRSSR